MLHEPHAPGSGRRSSTLILIALLLLSGISFGLHLNPEDPALKGLDLIKVRVGLGIFACIAFLWLTEALPLAITTLLVPLLACGFGLLDVKAALVSRKILFNG